MAALSFSLQNGTIEFMSEVRRPLIPQFTLRWILALTTVMAVISVVFTQALAGHAWAVGISILLMALVIAFVVYAAAFAGVSLLADLLETVQRTRSNRSTGQVLAEPQGSGGPPSAAIILALVIATCGRSTFAASGTSITLPVLGPGQTNTTGLTLTVDTTWVDSSGYRPVRIELKSITGPVTADRVLTIRIRPKQYYSAVDSVVATQVIEIPAGAAKTAATISVPAISAWGMFDLDTIEDGQLVEQLSTKNLAPSFSGTFSGAPKGDGGSPVVLLLNGDNTSLASSLLSINPQFIEIISVGGPTPQLPSAAVPGGPVANIGTALSGLSNLPAGWIDYSGLDLIVTSLSKLAVLKDANGAQYAAILDWVKSGGTLIVYGIDSDWGSLQRLDSLAAFDDDSKGDSAQGSAAGNWIAPRRRLNSPLGTLQDSDGTPYTTRRIGSRNGSTSSNNTGAVDDTTEDAEDDSVPRGDAPFLTRSRGVGMVVAIRSDPSNRNFTANNFTWPWLLNTIGSNRWNWRERWGVSLYVQNDHFWDFLIPGVGLVPVVQFQVLITLFVIAIGPVNYYLFKRLGKLNLMVLTVPAGALAVTSSLLIYAVIADGFSVRARARSYTHIDQRSGEAQCWTRLSYYAGLSPSGGLTFSQDTSVIPLLAYPGEIQTEPARALVWARTNPSDANSSLEQRLTEGWLRSRTPTQFITARVHKTAARLDVKPVGSGAPPQVNNQLGTPIKWLFLVDDDGNCYRASAVATGAVAALSPVESQVEGGAGYFQRLLSENEPAPPLGSQTDGRSVFGLYRQPQVPYVQNLQYQMGNAGYNQLYNSGGSGTLERELADLVEQMVKDKLPPKTYVAVVESSPEVELGTPSAREESSFHVIRGQW
jgi:hypothetical protein